MKTIRLSAAISAIMIVMMLAADVVDLHAQPTGVYVGGHIRRERPNTITKLKQSGFSYVILFNVSVETDGTLTTDGETICRNGQYVFANTQPNYVADVKALKTAPTSISRIEICIGGWGNESYDRIKSLINSQGTGSGSILYRNFKALKDAIPEIDAVNNDDEHCYDASTALSFHNMMYNIGYKTTLAPYTNYNFWNTLATQLGNKCDRILIQCYDGGAGNNPSNWHLNNITLHAGRTNYQTDMNTSINQMQSWKNNNGVSGGFVWVYNDETWNLNAWASAMNRVFNTKTTDRGVATFYSDANYGGYAISLPEGNFSQGEMALYGITAKDVSSLKVKPGFKVTLYANADLSGTAKTWTGNASSLGSDWNDKACSVKIEPNGKSGLEGVWKLQGYNSKLFWDFANSSTATDARLIQNNQITATSQDFRFTEISAGVYSIVNVNSGKYIDVMAGSTANWADIVQAPHYPNNKNQQWIILDKGDGYYMLVARHCGKIIEVPYDRRNAGEEIKIYDNNDQKCGWWKFTKKTQEKPAGYPVATIYEHGSYGGYAVSLPEGSYTLAQLQSYGMKNDDISSLKVISGYKVIAYTDDNFSGQSATFTANTDYVGNEWNDKFTSFKVEAQGVSGLAGRYKLQGRNSQLFWGFENASTANNAMLEQQNESNNNTQKFELSELSAGSGIYRIANVNSGKYISVYNASVDNRGSVVQAQLGNNDTSQQWIAVDKGSGYYAFVARHCGKIIEVPNDIRNAGEDLKTWDDNGQQCGWWKLVEADVIQTGPIGNYNVATFYQDINNGGYAVSLPEGNYTQEQLAAYGIRNNDISSFSVTPGFKVIIFDGSSFDGDTQTWTASSTWIGNQWNDRASSIRIEPNGATGLSGTWKLQNRNSGKYMDLDGNRTDNNTAIVQWDNEGTELYQQWRLNEVAPGVYTIQAAATSNRGLDVANMSTDNWAQVLLYDYWNGFHQQFILFDKGGGYYQLVARHCGKPVELAYASTASGEWIRIYDNNGSDCQQWRLVNPATAYATAPASDATGIKTMHNEECIMHNAPAVYDLQGRKVADNPSSLISNPSSKPGIYIYNGKKIMVK